MTTFVEETTSGGHLVSLKVHGSCVVVFGALVHDDANGTFADEINVFANVTAREDRRPFEKYLKESEIGEGEVREMTGNRPVAARRERFCRYGAS
jgi:hypothetical protein